jgi:hypothetical protein
MKINTGCWVDGCKCFNPNDEDGVWIKKDRDWVGLTDDEIADAFGDYMDSVDETEEEEEHNWDYERLIEAKVKEKNGYLKEEK